MKFFPLFFLALLWANTTLKAQTVDWAQQFGYLEISNGKVHKLAKNKYLRQGSIRKPVDFDGDSTTPIIEPIGNESTDFFIWTDSTGKQDKVVLWGGNEHNANSGTLKRDKYGNYYMMGSVEDSANFNIVHRTPSYRTGIPHNYTGRYLAKFDSLFNPLWVNTISDTGRDINPIIMDIDPEGNCYFSGLLTTRTDIDPGQGEVFYKYSSYNFFTAKYTASGKLDWHHQVEFTKEGRVWGIKYSQGKVYVNGFFKSSADFDPGIGTASFAPKRGTDGFIASYDARNGHFISVAQLSGATERTAYKMAVDELGNVYVTGTLFDSLDVNPLGTPIILKGHSYHNAYMCKYSSDLKAKWATVYAASYGSDAQAIYVEKSAVFVTGKFKDTLFVERDSMPRKPIVAKSKRDVFIARYDTVGHMRWMRRYYSSSLSYAAVYINPVSETEYFQMGRFHHFIDLNNGSDSFMLRDSSGKNVSFFARIVDKKTARTFQYDTICQGEAYTYSNGRTLAGAGKQSHWHITRSGEDSIVTTTVAERQLSSNWTAHNDSLVASQKGLRYTWLNCKTQQSLQAPDSTGYIRVPESGDYALVVNNGGCIDTSLCALVMVVSTTKPKNHKLLLYPNPTSTSLHFTYPNVSDLPNQWCIYNALGKGVMKGRVASKNKIQLSQLNPGVYRMVVANGDNQNSAVFVKE